MPRTYFFYDIETSGLDRSHQRVIQFAGQRTDESLRPIGDPVNVVVALHPDVLPSPRSVCVNGTSPQDLQAGMGEPEFCELLLHTVFTPGTVAAGFNNVRFDDQFVRQLLWRNFHDPYEWAYRDGRGRFDVYNLLLTFRALRPDAIVWPNHPDGSVSNTLGDVCEANGLAHACAHDALDDILATIELTRLLRDTNPKLFAHFMNLREKRPLEAFVSKGHPFVYVHQTFGADRCSAALVAPIYKTARGQMMVYDLMVDPDEFAALSDSDLHACLFAPADELDARGLGRAPVKRLTFNKNPGVAPAAVATAEAPSAAAVRQRLGLDLQTCQANFAKLQHNAGLLARVRAAFDAHRYDPDPDVEGTLYDGSFPTGPDRDRCKQVTAAGPEHVGGLDLRFDDDRYAELLFRYQARNAPGSLSAAQAERWDRHVRARRTPCPEWHAEWQAERDAAAAASDDALVGKLDELLAWAQQPADMTLTPA